MTFAMRVSCYRCRKIVEKADSNFVSKAGTEECFECINCSKKDKNSSAKHIEENGVKQELYCERCRYKFVSKKIFCPYCNQADMIIKGNVSVNDLL